jgi:uncharacterized protein YjbJ (UPF0337 family)
MSAVDKAKNKAEQMKGQIKEVAGRRSGDERLEAEGHTDQAKGNLKGAGEKLKDTLKS